MLHRLNPSSHTVYVLHLAEVKNAESERPTVLWKQPVMTLHSVPLSKCVAWLSVCQVFFLGFFWHSSYMHNLPVIKTYFHGKLHTVGHEWETLHLTDIWGNSPGHAFGLNYAEALLNTEWDGNVLFCFVISVDNLLIRICDEPPDELAN